MTQENFNVSDDLEQIVEKSRSGIESLEQLKTYRPDLTDDLTAIQEGLLKNIGDLEEIQERVERENDGQEK